MATTEVEGGKLKERGGRKVTRKLRDLADKHEHLKKHLIEYGEKTGTYPELVKKPETKSQSDKYGLEKKDIIYQVDGPLFAHLHKGKKSKGNRYYVVEPKLGEEKRELFEKVRGEVFERAVSETSPENEESEEKLKELFNEIVGTEESNQNMLDTLQGNNTQRFSISPSTYGNLRYNLERDIAGIGPLEPLLRDRTNEDIHVVSSDEVHVDNKIFGMMETNVDLGTEEEYKSWLKAMTERIGKPVSDGNPLIDSSLPDGSRLNVIYSEDVSIEGPTLTIRQYEDIPPSIFQVIKWGTMSPELGAYLWLCVENDMSMAICGETAAGKTTTLNAATGFIPADHKIVSAEDTLELKIPHDAWQRLLTREGGGEETDVNLFNLITASLRARPDNMVVGEVRGKEAFNVFQAIQTGHPTLFTFHAGNIVALIRRFTGKPLNVPETFLGNLNVAVFQNFIKRGEKELRRVTSVQEIEGYSKRAEGIVTRRVFDWDPIQDRTRFLGRNNSFILEEKVAGSMGYSDPREIYNELGKRTEIIRKSLGHNMTGYEEAVDVINTYQRKGQRGINWNKLEGR